jgi:YVTN family beta-propeller protein
LNAQNRLLFASLPVLALGCSSGTGGSTPAPQPESTSIEQSELHAAALRLPTGDSLTPTAAPGSSVLVLNPGMAGAPNFHADHAASTAVSPDGKTLLVLTSGYNETNWIPTTAPSPGVVGYENPALSGEWVFVYDISHGAPVQKQVLTLPNSFSGIAFNPNGKELYVGGGQDDDVHVFEVTVSGSFTEKATPLKLGHTSALGLANGPVSAGLAVTGDGNTVVVANYENDSISLVTLATGAVVDLDLRPGKAKTSPQSGVAGGEYPFWVAIKGSTTAYVTSLRDAEVDVVDLTVPAVTARIPVGRQPNKAILNKAQTKLFVANGNDDTVSIIDTANNKVTETVPVLAPKSVFANPGGFKGANPNGLTLSPDEKTLYVTDGATNALAVVDLRARHDRDEDSDDGPRTVGLVPTGWYPTAVSTSKDGKTLYVTNAKSVAGPSCEDILTTAWGPQGTATTGPTTDQHCWNGNQYIWQLETASVLSLPTPKRGTLRELTEQVARNDRFDDAAAFAEDETIAFLEKHIKHVIYVIKENRTYDQVLGDLANGANGDPSLTMFGESTTPNFHALARQFVTLDNFLDSGETSGVGWNWTTAAHVTDQIERTQPINYGKGGFTYDWEGTNRNINVGIGTVAGRLAALPLTPTDPDLLPGAVDVASASAPGAGTAYLWDGATAAGLTVRNYGAFVDLARYTLSGTPYAALFPAEDRTPFKDGIQQAWSAAAGLQTKTDVYYRGFDMAYPDLWRYEEWKREFDGFVAGGNLPSLEIVRMPHDHTGSYGASETVSGLGTPLLQVADNDAAVGAMVAAVASSKYATDTLVFVIEDDAQDGPDHVDGHRSTAFVVGPYVKHGEVVSAPYDTVSMVRTIESILGFGPLGLYDALARPMSEVFDRHADPADFKYTALTSGALSGTKVLARRDPSRIGEYYAALKAGHNAAYWERVMKGQNFAREDDLDTEKFNRALWEGLMGSKPYPMTRADADANEKPYCGGDSKSHT